MLQKAVDDSSQGVWGGSSAHAFCMMVLFDIAGRLSHVQSSFVGNRGFRREWSLQYDIWESSGQSYCCHVVFIIDDQPEPSCWYFSRSTYLLDDPNTCVHPTI